jgi:uncharacterized protein
MTMTIQERAARGIPLADDLVIDGHAHYGWCSSVHAAHSDAEGLIDSMDRIGIRTACISSLMALDSDFRRGNDEVADAMRRYPGRFAGYAALNPNYPGEIDAELSRCLDGLGFWAAKLHPGFHNYPSDGPIYHRVYAQMQERRGAVLSHAFGGAETLARLAETYPDVLFIEAHWAGSYDGRRADPFISLLRERDNVYTDTVLSRVAYGGIEGLVEQVGADKLIFGTDAVFESNAHQIGRITHARLSEEDKLKILGLNMQRIMEGRWSMP